MLWKEKSLSKNNHCSSSPLISIGYLQSITVCSFSWGEMSWTLNMALITSLGGLTACNKDWRTKREREISHRRCRAGVWMKLSFGISVNSDLTNDLREEGTHRHTDVYWSALKHWKQLVQSLGMHDCAAEAEAEKSTQIEHSMFCSLHLLHGERWLGIC